MYESVAVLSLTQPKNLSAIPKDAVVSLYSDEATMARAVKASERLGRVEPHILDASGDTYDIQNRAFIEEVRICAKEGAALIIVNPDCFWGDGSLGNLLAIAGEQNVCVASAHVRVDKRTFLASPHVRSLPLDNRELVSLAMQSLHPSWIDADWSKPEANTFHTGIGIRQISDGMWGVTHLLPTIFYARPTIADYAFFAERKDARGLWDHVWPATLGNRQRTIADSDAFFVAELTDGATHNTPLRALDKSRPDDFHRTAEHIERNRQVVSIWRA